MFLFKEGLLVILGSQFRTIQNRKRTESVFPIQKEEHVSRISEKRKNKEKKQQYKTIGKLKPRKLDQIWNFYQKAVEQCEENSMIKQKLWEVQNRKEQKNKETGKDRKKANRESVEVLVCSSQWNTHNCAFNFNSKRYLN